MSRSPSLIDPSLLCNDTMDSIIDTFELAEEELRIDSNGYLETDYCTTNAGS